MSESDSFIREVTEEVRQDELARAWGRYKYLVIGGAVAAITAVSVWTWIDHQARQTALEAGGALLSADGATPEAQAALADTLTGGAGLIAGLRAAAALAATDADAAVARYRALAAQPGVDPIYGDLALLGALRLDAPRMVRTAFEAEIAPLVAEGRPYRLLALELRAAVLLNAGDTAAAVADLEAILADGTASRATQARTEALRATILAETPR